jgi:hypothetical protein
MTDEVRALFQAALALPPLERAELAERLLASLRDDPQWQEARAEREEVQAIRPSDVRDDE